MIIERELEGQKRYLLQERLEQPHYGFLENSRRQNQLGQKITDTASRELKEKTSLTGSFTHNGLYHEIVTLKESGVIIEDKVFHIMFCSDGSGELEVDFWKWPGRLAQPGRNGARGQKI